MECSEMLMFALQFSTHWTVRKARVGVGVMGGVEVGVDIWSQMQALMVLVLTGFAVAMVRSVLFGLLDVSTGSKVMSKRAEKVATIQRSITETISNKWRKKTRQRQIRLRGQQQKK